MKNILIFILLLISATSYAQILNDNTDVNTANEQPKEGLFWNGTTWVNARSEDNIFSYPFKYFYENDFSSNITGTTAFNGGVIAFNSGALRVVGSSSARGVLIGGAKTEGLQYIAKFTLSGVDPINGVRVVSEWADNISNPVFDGTHSFYFTEPADGNGDERLTIVTNGLDTFFISDLSIMEVVDNSELYIATDVDDLLRQKQDSINAKISESRYFSIDANMYYNSFENLADASRLVTVTNATKVWDASNNALDVTTTTSADRFYIGEQPTKRYSYQYLYLDIENVTDTIYVSAGQNSTDILMITEDGIYERAFYFDKAVSGILSTNIVYITAGKSGVSYQINEFRQSTFPDVRRALYADAATGVEVGNGTDAGDRDGTAVGYLASSVINTIFGGSGGPERTAVGETSRALAWRATAIGGNSFAGNTSSMAIGAGATSLKTHGLALGRGSLVPSLGWVSFANDIDLSYSEKSIYLNNGWGHQFNTPISGISIGSQGTPSTVEVKINAQDAFDARYPAYNAGTTYSIGSWVQRNDSVFISTVGTTGNDPGLADDWTYLYTTSGGVPSSFNVDAGDIGIYAGRATGTGTSGSINLYVAEGNNGQNTKDTTKKAMELRSDEALTTGTFLWLLNEATGTMQRMVIDTKPAVSGANGIIGFSKGYKPE